MSTGDFFLLSFLFDKKYEFQGIKKFLKTINDLNKLSAAKFEC
jgi:hypothetical protein